MEESPEHPLPKCLNDLCWNPVPQFVYLCTAENNCYSFSNPRYLTLSKSACSPSQPTSTQKFTCRFLCHFTEASQPGTALVTRNNYFLEVHRASSTIPGTAGQPGQAAGQNPLSHPCYCTRCQPYHAVIRTTVLSVCPPVFRSPILHFPSYKWTIMGAHCKQ